MSDKKKFSIKFNLAFNDEVAAKTFRTDFDVLMEIAEGIPGMDTSPTRVESAERVISETLESLGAEGEFFFNSDPHSPGVCSIMPVPEQLQGQNQVFVMYNPEYMAAMDKKHIAANIAYSFQLFKLLESQTLVCINRRTGEWKYKGELVTYMPNNDVNTPIEQCSPWRQDILSSLCEELEIPLTNELSQLTGIEQTKAQEIYNLSVERHQAALEYRRAVIAYRDKQHA